MASEISTIQSLKAVDSWIDVINSNINGGVRTAFKASRLKFSGSNVDITRAGTTTSLPLQFPEPGLTTANTVIDFTQGAVTASTENSHLAIQGSGFFILVDPASISSGGTGAVDLTSTSRVFVTRDGEFRTNQNGFLVNNAGYFLATASINAGGSLTEGNMRLVYNNLDVTTNSATATSAVRLSDFLTNTFTSTSLSATGGALTGMSTANAIAKVTLGAQSLTYTQFGSTVFSFGYTFSTGTTGASDASIRLEQATTSDATLLSKSLEASNASMTQSVPELSLAQKLFSALTKVLQTKQTNVDGVLNLVR